MDTKKTTKARELDSRTDGPVTVSLFYHGAEATPKLTVEVVDSSVKDGGSFVLEPTDENCMDMYHHPYAYYKAA